MSGTSGQPGRYQRSSSGLLGAMIVLVVGLLIFVSLRGCTREVPDGGVDPVDYHPVATQARQAGLLAPAPTPLPSGWQATSARFTPPDKTTSRATGSWHLGLLTKQKRYVGIEETSGDVDSLLSDTVPDATRGPVVRIEGRTWRSFTGSQGSYALTTSDAGGRDVLVGSPAGERVVRGVVDRITLPAPAAG